MNKTLESILLKITRLSASHQRWILNQLPNIQRLSLHQHQGYQFLHDAIQKIKRAPVSQQINDLSPSNRLLPFYCEQLATKSPLYAAIIIEQSEPSWIPQFLSTYDQDGIIQNLLKTQVLNIKPHVKKFVFNEWQQSIRFEDYLEESHG